MPRVINTDQGSPELAPTRSNTPLTDGLRSGGNVRLVGPNRPFWDEDADLMSGQFSGRVVPVAPVARGYLDPTDFYGRYMPAGDYTVSIPNEADKTKAGSPAADVGESVVPARDYF